MNGLPPIPFVGTIDRQIREQWLTGLRSSLPGMEISAFDDHDLDYWRSSKVSIVANPRVEDLKQLPNLKWVQSLWAGVETLVPTLPQGISIVRMVDPQMAKTMAEAVLTLTLYLHRDLPKYSRQQRERVWMQHEVIRAENRKVTVLGLGAMGRAACHALVQQGFDVSGWSRLPKSIPNIRCFHGEPGLNAVLTTSDILIVLLPLTQETKGLFDKTRLSRLKKDASIINFARAPIIDTDALVEKLRSGKLKHAVLDVFSTEPLANTDAIWTAPNITILPHVSAPTNINTASEIAAKNIMSFIQSGRIPQGVDRSRGY